MLPFLVSLIMVGQPLPFSAMIAPPDPKEIWIEQLHQCENESNVKRILDANGYYSYGAFMYQMKTWLNYGARFGATRANIGDDDLQRKVTRYTLDTVGWQHDWVICGKRTVTLLGSYPD